MLQISEVYAREILDSRGNPTIYARVRLNNGVVGISSVPSGASTGKREAVELRDGDFNRMNGKGVLKAVSNITDRIAPAIKGMDAMDQVSIDNKMIELDATDNKANLGANALLATSLAVLRASANASNLQVFSRFAQLFGTKEPLLLPLPLFNILNGGVHAFGSTDFQEFMIAPIGATTFYEALYTGVAIYHQLGILLTKQGISTNVGFEGGYAPQSLSNRQALGFITRAIETAGYLPGEDVVIAIDSAASELYTQKSQRYNLVGEGRRLTSQDMIEEYQALYKEFPILSIEDGLAEDDWQGWQALTKQCGNHIQLVGDDLFVTQSGYIRQGIKAQTANAVLIKLNQVGTVTETLSSMKIAKEAGMGLIVSHRSGETEDTTIADLSVGTSAGQIKAGAPARGERTAKYNRLLIIEEELGNKASYCGYKVLNRFLK